MCIRDSISTSPESFKGGGVWNVIVNINDGLKAVSYTHLDVYKRQERACVVAEYGKEVRKIEQRISEFTASHPVGRHGRSRSLSAGTER